MFGKLSEKVWHQSRLAAAGAYGGCVLKGNPWLDHLSKPRQLLHHLRVIMSLQRWIDCCFVIKFLPRKDFQKVRSFVSLPVRGACNVKEFT